jgi:pimeloyl-ACP methyl ester carboxylesterase
MRPEFAGVSMDLVSTDSETSCKGRVAFIDGCFGNSGPSQAKKWEWIGMGCMLSMSTPSLIGMRTNDDTKLFEAARSGLPTLYIHGTEDKTLDTVALEALFKEKFSALDIHRIEGGSHSPFADDDIAEFAEVVRKFANSTFLLE